MSTLDHKLLHDIGASRGQIAAIALVVACGISVFVAMLAAYRSLELSQRAYYRANRFADVFAHLTRAPRALEARIAALPGVATAQVRVISDVSLDVPGREEPATGRLVSVPERARPRLDDLSVRAGRYLQPSDRSQVLVSEAFANANHLHVGSLIGAVINGRLQHLRVVGIALSPEFVYEIHGATDIWPDSERFGVIWMGERALSAAFDMQGAFNDLEVALAPGADEQAVVERIDALLARYGGLGAYGRADQPSHRFLSSELAQLRVSATIVPAIFLGIAIFLLHLLLSRTVGTQRTQIAMLKAFGYGNGAIGLHYVWYGLVIVASGALLGLGAGLWLGWILTRYYGVFFHFPILRFQAGIGLLALTLLLVALAGVAGSLAGVRSAMLLPPAEAMRPQPPARYRPALVERMGLHALLPSPIRMILRNVERAPLKSLLSCAGLALGVATLVVGRSSFDAIDLMLAHQFYVIEREDATIAFDHTVSLRASHELAALPGVIRVEPFRAVPIRVRKGHRSRRIALLALDARATLYRIVDLRGRVLQPPRQGILLNERLAQALGVRPGERIALDVLESARATRSVRVAATVDELIGTTAYMERGAAARLLREGPAISGAYVGVDARERTALEAALKRMPSVANVAFRDRTIANFRSTIAQSLAVSTALLILFATVIAFGVVYNSARIALAEHGRELAVLRILGFTRGEVTLVLLGEQALLTATAIPAGIVAGRAIALSFSAAYSSELYRIPTAVSTTTEAFATLVIAAAAFVCGMLFQRQLAALDLVGALKIGE
ncbi:ABC transporter permease [bacterium]|nr:MAG: ABC transporter permease [bacterium]